MPDHYRAPGWFTRNVFNRLVATLTGRPVDVALGAITTANNNKYPAPDFTYPGGAQAYLYSALDQITVNMHFDWMRDYGIDGVVVQRFVSQLPPQSVQVWKTNVLNYSRAAANRTGEPEPAAVQHVDGDVRPVAVSRLGRNKDCAVI